MDLEPSAAVVVPRRRAQSKIFKHALGVRTIQPNFGKTSEAVQHVSVPYCAASRRRPIRLGRHQKRPCGLSVVELGFSE